MSYLISVFLRDEKSRISALLSQKLRSLSEKDDVELKYFFGQPIDNNRNQAVRYFLETDKEWLVMFDDDIIPSEDFLSVTRHGFEIVSGLVGIERETMPFPLVARSSGKNRYVYADPADYIYTSSRFVKVDGVGAACLAVRRNVLEDVEEPWFRFVYDDYGTLKKGEDYYFSEKCKESGHELFVSLEHPCQHYKKTDLTKYAGRMAQRDARIRNLENILDSEKIKYPEKKYLRGYGVQKE